MDRSRRAAWLLVLVVALVAGAGAVYLAGGTQGPWPHLLYVPILLAAARYGVVGAVGVAVAAGILLGPTVPLDAPTGVSQQPADWLTRAGFYVLVGATAGLLHRRLGRATGEAQRSEGRFRALVRDSPDLVLVEDLQSGIRYASPAAASILGRAPGELIGTRLVDLVHEEDRPRLAGAPASGGLDVRARHADGSWRHLEVICSDLRADPEVRGILVNARDVTARRALEAEVAFRTTHDAATGLPVRSAFLERVAEVLDTDGCAPKLLVLGIDRFGQLTAALGHELAGSVLITILDRVTRTMPRGTVLGRHGEGELCAFWSHGDAGRAERLVAAVVSACEAPVAVGDREVLVSVSAGLVAGASSRVGAEHLLRAAHAAKGVARAKGGGGWVAHREDMVDELSLRLETEAALHRALEHHELRLEYQPVVDLRTGLISGAEALLRWDHPRLGTISPAQFIPIAEETGSIVEIGQHVLGWAWAQSDRLREQVPGAGTLSMSVNVSPRQLRDAALVGCLRDLTGRAGFDSRWMEFEITEGCVLDGADGSMEQLRALRSLGARLAIDDFGTGFSSLSYLTQLHADTLKIDRSFIRGLAPGSNEERVVSAIVGLARNMGMTTTAEGVETAGQLASLVSMGCDAAQGYHFAPPVAGDELAELLRTQPFRQHALSQVVL